MAFDGLWLIKGRYETRATGVHQQFDDDGPPAQRAPPRRPRPRQSRTRLDESGTVIRDDEVFEDGSRKA